MKPLLLFCRIALRNPRRTLITAVLASLYPAWKVARAIVGAPQLVLADEPTASLDSTAGAELLTLLLRLNQEQRITFVFSSHDPGIIQRAHRVLRLKDGVVSEPGG